MVVIWLQLDTNSLHISGFQLLLQTPLPAAVRSGQIVKSEQGERFPLPSPSPPPFPFSLPLPSSSPPLLPLEVGPLKSS